MLSKDEVAVLGVVSIFLVIMSGSFSATDEYCRRDAIDSMCGSYGGATGGVIDVWPYSIDGGTGYYVLCDNVIGDSVEDRFKYIVINMSRTVE